MSAELHETDRLRAQLNLLRDQVAAAQRERNGFEIAELHRVQARADSVMALHHKRARDPALSETLLEYRRALVGELAEHSPKYKNANFRGYDAQSISAAEDVIYSDAVEAARNTANATPGLLVAERYRDAAGRMITRWNGDWLAWAQHFMTGAQLGHVCKPSGKAPGT